MLTDAQLKQRLNYVTGSDASVICGINPWKNRVELYLEKTGYSNQKDLSGNPFVKAGIYLEDAVAKWFEDETDLKTRKPEELIIHPEHNWMAGNIDRFIIDSNAILEIKTSSSYKGWGENGDDETVPLHYKLQCAHYCAVTNSEVCYIAVLFKGMDFRIYKHQRHKALEDILIEKERAFWFENVLMSVAPEAATKEEALHFYESSFSEKSTISTSEVEHFVEEYRKISQEIKSLEELRDEVKDSICVHMKDSELLLSQHGKPLVSWKTSKPIKRFDKAAFDESYPGMTVKFLKECKPSRPFVLIKD